MIELDSIFAFPDSSVSRAEFEEIKSRCRSLILPRSSIVSFDSATPSLNALLALGHELNLELILASGALKPEARKQLLNAHRANFFIENGVINAISKAASFSSGQGRIGLFTSGTTGAPKLVWHAWERLKRAGGFVPQRLRGRRWAMTYVPTSFAGLQVFYSCLASDGALVYMPRDFVETCRRISQEGVEVISATPTYWKMILRAWPRDLAKPKIRQATLGGEVVNQDILDAVRNFFSPEGLAHIYASTEAGSAIVVSDGKEGFPASLLGANSETSLKIRDGFLEVRSPGAMLGYEGQMAPAEGQWYTTPDRVELRGDRVHFIGRGDAVINLGGRKIFPEEVEKAVLSIAGIEECSVYGKASPITGEIMIAEIELKAGAALTPAELRRRITDTLPAGMAPQVIRIVDKVRIGDNGKKLKG